jgi:hypothetical protein
MSRKNSKHKPYRKKRTDEEERQLLEQEKKRLEFRLSHQNECFIPSVKQEEMELESIINTLQNWYVISDEDLETLHWAWPAGQKPTFARNENS